MRERECLIPLYFLLSTVSSLGHQTHIPELCRNMPVTSRSSSRPSPPILSVIPGTQKQRRSSLYSTHPSVVIGLFFSGGLVKTSPRYRRDSWGHFVELDGSKASGQGFFGLVLSLFRRVTSGCAIYPETMSNNWLPFKTRLESF